MTNPNQKPSEKECLDILANAICDAGYWSWWTSKLPGIIQVEFGGTQLYFSPTDPAKPPSSLIAVQFRNPVSISFLSIHEPAIDGGPKWYELLHDDKMKPLNCDYEAFSFTDEKMIREIVAGVKTIDTIQTVQGRAPKDDAFWSGRYNFAFMAGGYGMAISAEEIQLHTHSGPITLDQIPSINAQWWEYWKKYWAAKETKDPLPEDYACEVTIPVQHS